MRPLFDFSWLSLKALLSLALVGACISLGAYLGHKWSPQACRKQICKRFKKAVEIICIITDAPLKWSCSLLKRKKNNQPINQHHHHKQLSGSTLNQLLTAKGKYNLFFTLLRKIRFIYLTQSRWISCLWKPHHELPSPTWMALPGSLVPVHTDFCSILLAGLSQPAEKQTKWQRTRLFQKPGFWLLEVRQKVFICFFLGGGGVPGGCVLRRKALGGEAVLPWPEEGALRLWYTPGWKKEKSGNAKPPVFLLLLLFYFSR